LTVVEDVQNVSAKNAPKPRGSRHPRLTQDEEREIARLYADTSTTTSEICARLGIGESSLYRIVQRQGVPLRGRTGASRAAASRRQPAPAPKPQAAAAPTQRRGRTPRAAVVASSAPAASTGRRFRIRYHGERVFEARTMLEALRQAESLGATEIIGVAREER
jgi:transposase-like protein